MERSTTLLERYHGKAVFVWTENVPPFCWRYTINGFDYNDCGQERFTTPEQALQAGLDAARAKIAVRRPTSK